MMNLLYVVVINNSQIVCHNTLEIYSQITWCSNTQRRSVVRCLSSIILLEKENRKRLIKILCKYIYYGVSTKDLVLIRDPAFISVMMLFPLATKEDKAFIRDWLQFKATWYFISAALYEVQGLNHFCKSGVIPWGLAILLFL